MKMQFFPKIKRCPCCDSFIFLKINGITYENKFKSLIDWELKKQFKCKKCSQELGLFVHLNYELEKIVWIDFIKCEDIYYKELNDLHLKITKLDHKSEKYASVGKKISNIQNKIRSDQIKLRVKLKVQSKGSLIRHVYS